MAIEVDVDGEIIEFPDGMSDDEINQAIASHLSGQTPQQDTSQLAAATMSAPEAYGRGAVFGAVQTPRDVLAATYAKLMGGVPFRDRKSVV